MYFFLKTTKTTKATTTHFVMLSNYKFVLVSCIALFTIIATVYYVQVHVCFVDFLKKDFSYSLFLNNLCQIILLKFYDS